MIKNNLVKLISTTALLLLGILMILLAKPHHSGGWERADTYFIEEIWSHASGLTIIVFGLVILTVILINRNKPERAKPGILSKVIFAISFFILKVTVLLYAIMIIQYLLGNNKILSPDYSFDDESLSTISMVCITFIFVFGIITLISWLVSRRVAK
jgi:hypothetical protein